MQRLKQFTKAVVSGAAQFYYEGELHKLSFFLTSSVVRKSVDSLQLQTLLICDSQTLPVETNALTRLVCAALSPPELLRALHPQPQGSGDQGVQDGGGRSRRRGKPHVLQNLSPDRRGEGRVDQQHQVSHV